MPEEEEVGLEQGQRGRFFYLTRQQIMMLHQLVDHNKKKMKRQESQKKCQSAKPRFIMNESA